MVEAPIDIELNFHSATKCSLECTLKLYSTTRSHAEAGNHPLMAAEQYVDESLRPPNSATSRKLFRLGMLGLAGVIVGLVHQSPWQDPILLTMGSLVLVFGATPALNWARKCDTHFPIFEVFMLTTIPFYGISLLAGHQEVLAFSVDTTLQAAGAILLFQSCAIAAFTMTPGIRPRSRIWSSTLLPQSIFRFAQAGLWLNTTYLYVSGFTDAIPAEFRILFRSMFFGVGTVALFIEMRRWGLAPIPSGTKARIVLNLVLQIVFLFRELYLIAGISLLLLALLAYVSTSRRVPITAVAIVLPILAVLHSGKAAMRQQYWEQRRPLPDLVELPGYFEHWFNEGLKGNAEEREPTSSTLSGRLFERASLFQMLCLVVDRTPGTEPYLFGESYVYIPAQIIPSFLWPGKPSSLLSNTLLAVHYRLVAEDSTTSVSIAFGLVAESYANFGIVGCAVIGVLLGYFYKRVTVASIGIPQFSAVGLLTILLGAWSFQAEQILATWLVSLFQASLVVIGIPLVWRILFRPE